MKASELRIGNLVQPKDKNWPLRVIHVEFIELDDDTNRYSINDFDQDEIEPIALSEEWRLKFGFIKILNWGLLLKISEAVEIAFYQGKYWIIPEDGPTTSHWIPLNIEFVHQLQNLYFALKGEEPTINQSGIVVSDGLIQTQ